MAALQDARAVSPCSSAESPWGSEEGLGLGLSADATAAVAVCGTLCPFDGAVGGAARAGDKWLCAEDTGSRSLNFLCRSAVKME